MMFNNDNGKATKSCPIKEYAQFSNKLDDILYNWKMFLINKYIRYGAIISKPISGWVVFQWKDRNIINPPIKSNVVVSLLLFPLFVSDWNSLIPNIVNKENNITNRIGDSNKSEITMSAT